MRIQSAIPDDEVMDDCVSLTYNIEFGELHERDKYSWVEIIKNVTLKEEDENEHEEFDYIFKKTKFIDFEFKMNHIRQIIKIEIMGNYKKKNNQILNQKQLFVGFYSFSRAIRKSGILISPDQIGSAAFTDINV